MSPSKKKTRAASVDTQDVRASKTPSRQKTVTKRATRVGKKPATVDGASAVRENLAAMPEPDRRLGERLHEIILSTAPELVPRLWYGMPAWAKDGKVICFFQSAAKFKTRYATLGFLHEANLDDGAMWPTAFALTALTAVEEARVAALVKQAGTRGA